jgi:hypothetical protein
LQISISIKHYSDIEDYKVVDILVYILIVLLFCLGIFIIPVLFKLLVKRSIFSPGPSRPTILESLSKLTGEGGEPSGGKPSGGGPSGGGPSGEGPSSKKRKRDAEDSSSNKRKRDVEDSSSSNSSAPNYEYFNTRKDNFGMPEGLKPEDIKPLNYGPGYGIFNTPSDHFIRTDVDVPPRINRNGGPCQMAEAIKAAKTYENIISKVFNKPEIQYDLSFITDEKARLEAEQIIVNNTIKNLPHDDKFKNAMQAAMDDRFGV